MTTVQNVLHSYGFDNHELGEQFTRVSEGMAKLLPNGISDISEKFKTFARDLSRTIDLIPEGPSDTRDGVDRISGLPDHVLSSICDYLTVGEINSFMLVSSNFHKTLSPHSSCLINFWKQEFSAWCASTSFSCQGYLAKRLEYERYELAHMEATAELANALLKVGRDVIGISGNIGRFPSAQIAMAITRRRPQALCGAIIKNPKVGVQFRKLTAFNNSVSFMVITPGAEAERPSIEAPGFIGYALDLLELRPDEEYLRETVLASFVYRDLTVWDSLASVTAAIRNGAYSGSFYCVVNDRRNDLDVMDDDAPRADGEQALEYIMQKKWPLAPYLHFRPRLYEMKQPLRKLADMRSRVSAMETALIRDSV